MKLLPKPRSAWVTSLVFEAPPSWNLRVGSVVLCGPKAARVVAVLHRPNLYPLYTIERAPV